ncbi:hypothetical protein [Comamonas odontotermitis]|uniref:hypothetical protein n=1 Tax=Comamonas odontotermitis TaxID=379895 RepID=UPI0037534D97
MQRSKEDDHPEDTYLDQLKGEGAELLIRSPPEGTVDRARLSLIDAKIEQLTSPIVVADWKKPTA